jgi:hypothetical protein
MSPTENNTPRSQNTHLIKWVTMLITRLTLASYSAENPTDVFTSQVILAADANNQPLSQFGKPASIPN